MTLYTPAIFYALCREDFQLFLENALKVVHPDLEYEETWYVQACCHALDQVRIGVVRRQIITQPPRTLKSFTASVAWPAFLLGPHPGIEIICASYSDELAKDFARQFRVLVESAFYRSVFPGTRFRRTTDTTVTTTRGGFRLATSTGGTLTGKGADVIIIDDPLKADEAHSESARNGVNRWFGSTLYSRRNNSAKSAIVVVMQRLHANDLAGYLLDLEQDDWEHLRIPAVSQEDQSIPIGLDESYLFKKGELLNARRLPADELKHHANILGISQYNAQYLQDPAPADGNIVKLEHIRHHQPAELPEHGFLIHSWDTAQKPGESNDYSVCTTLLASPGGKYFVKNVIREKLVYTALKRRVIQHAADECPDIILIEDSSSGTALIEDLRETSLPVLGPKPDFDKATRLWQAMVLFEAGKVMLPKDAPWLDVLVRELLVFPNGKHDDQVDSLVQALRWAKTRQDEYSLTTAPVVFLPKYDGFHSVAENYEAPLDDPIEED